MTKAVYTLAVLVSSFLLFLVQPMFARMLLPSLGGSPAVWNTALVFYQGTLLLGYAYAHWAARKLTGRWAALHLAFLALGVCFLPLGLKSHILGPAPVSGSPVSWLLGMLALGVGVPFFLVSASSPLLQAWFSRTGHRQAVNPYFLYAASNIGSLVALLGYPVIFELPLELKAQSGIWTWGYVALLVLFVGCVALLPKQAAETPQVEPRPKAAEDWRRVARWVALAFVPSCLLMGVTTYISTEIAAVPLMWVVPLAIYLLTFILAFSERQPVPHKWVKAVAPFFIVAPLVVIIGQYRNPLWASLIAGFGGFFVCSWACHGELASDKPETSRLTEFFLWISLGGVLGGIFCGLVAPIVFKQVLEYPIALVLCTALLSRRSEKGKTWDVAFIAGTALAAFLSLLYLKSREDWFEWLSWQAMIVPAIIAVLASSRPVRFAASVAIVAGVPIFFGPMATGRTYQSRGFFGTLLVRKRTDQTTLLHGTTLHGQQPTDPSIALEPSSYYHRTGPAGDILETRPRPAGASIGVVGLGVGTLLAYSRPGEDWTIYEIDPEVVKVASDPHYFTYLSRAKGRWVVDLGDARLNLTKTTKSFDLLLLDAYSSDAVPVHLVTVEAFRTYFSRIRPGGLLAVHISNRYMYLWPIFSSAAKELGLIERRWFDTNTVEFFDPTMHPYKNAANWLVLGRRVDDLGPLATDDKWSADPVLDGFPVWTDERSSILTVLKGSPWCPVKD